MARGGPRPNAGRKPGGQNAKSREIADRAAAEGVTPLEVMLWAMREAFEAKDVGTALDAANKAAPYIHPRLASIQQNVTLNAHEDAIDELS